MESACPSFLLSSLPSFLPSFRDVLIPQVWPLITRLFVRSTGHDGKKKKKDKERQIAASDDADS
jgi:hypothetical protein